MRSGGACEWAEVGAGSAPLTWRGLSVLLTSFRDHGGRLAGQITIGRGEVHMSTERSPSPHELARLLERVVDEASFLEFVEALVADRRLDASGSLDEAGRGSNGWENHTIESFLAAATAWARDSTFGRCQGLGDAHPWKRFAVFLYCGKIYE